MALSRRDWNNVIIFAVLALMLLFYIVPQQLALLRQQQPLNEKVIPAGAPLVQLQFSQTNVQQAGVVWHFQPQLQSNNSAAEIASAWQQLELQAEVNPPQIDSQPIERVVLLLAGADSAQHWWLFLHQQQYYLQRQGQATFYPLTDSQYQQLFVQPLAKQH
jgi:hypothetical protein